MDIKLLNKVPSKKSSTQLLFSKAEFINTICNCNNSSTPDPNKLSQRYLNIIVKDAMCLKKIIDIADACFELGYQSLHFKTLTSIIIPKPNKESPKLFKPIVLLNTISKLIKKVIGERLQFYSISNNSTHPSQLGRLKQWSIINAGVALTYFICSGWVKNINTSTLAFDIAQFFPFLNYQLLLRIFDKASFDLKVSRFFENYLVEQKTQYVWNFFSSFLFNIDIGVGQESALSPILSALYIFPILYIFD